MRLAVDVIASGLATGTAVVLREESVFSQTTARSRDAEVQALADARQSLREEFARARSNADGAVFEILDAQRTIVDDDAWWNAVLTHVDAGAPAAQALDNVAREWAAAFEGLRDASARARVEDFDGIVRRMKSALVEVPRSSASETRRRSSTAGRVCFCDAPDVLDVLAAVDGGAVAFVVVGALSSFGHASIVLRSLGLPSVRIAELPSGVSGRSVVVDGIRGEVIVDPSTTELESVARRSSALAKRAAKNAQRTTLAVETRNGHRVQLFASVDSAVPLGTERLGDGIGLLRSEIAFALARVLDVDAQLAVYSNWLRLAQPRRLVVRTFDVDVDKPLPLPLREHTAEWHAVWQKPTLPTALLAQLEALLRLAVEGDVRLLLPRVSEPETVVACFDAMRAVAQDLSRREIAHRIIPIGAMIESGASAARAQELASVADFIAVGTSDLASSVLATPRSHLPKDALCELSVLRALDLIRRNVPSDREMWLCGAGLASLRALELALGLGFTAFTVDVASLERAALDISLVDSLEAMELARSRLR